MRNWIAVATIAIVVSMGLMGMGCDKMPWSKSEPKAEPQQPAPPPAPEKRFGMTRTVIPDGEADPGLQCSSRA